MEVNFNGKRAIVTGAGKGIGRAITVQLVALGAEVFALGRTQADLDSLKVEIPNINTYQIDLQNWEKTREIVTHKGPVDFLVNNAGIGRWQPFLEMSKENLDAVMNTNFNATFNVSQVVAKGMVERGQGGSIVNISSISSKSVIDDKLHSAYCPSKAAVDMLTRCMALELGPHNIRVNSVNPSLVWTDLTREAWGKPEKADQLEVFRQLHPLGKFIEMEDVVNTVMFLLSDKCSSTHGINLRIDAGYGVR
ncbi:L-xylulose reductase-like [Mytilus californianus]|uniref:L-xylulose reductase-like n=1 Tax=Mytilus californianus TaxID=6549 RepID=UPI0022454359|nr:L-xylulose reductase-like [Mytilus californianus]